MFWKWIEGRQKTKYQKMLIAQSKKLCFDIWLIKYVDSNISLHIDPSPLEGKKHHRINIILRKPEFGGFFINFGEFKTYFNHRVIYFNPSDSYHFLSKAYGKRLVLSIGWLKAI